MDVFTIKNSGKSFMLNIDNFEELTKKRPPYYQYDTDNKLKCYAVCPECGNPIHIINLYGAEMMQNKTGLITTYAKHTKGKIEGFDFWNPFDKENCSLYNPTPLGNTEIKYSNDYSEELRKLIENNNRIIFKDIREIVCINLSSKIINRLYGSVMNSTAYLKNNGVEAKGRYNQVANFTYLDTQVNKAVRDDAPNIYFGKALEQCENKKIAFGNISDREAFMKNLEENSIPKSVVSMTVKDYDVFLAERRVLMSQLIEKYYKGL